MNYYYNYFAAEKKPDNNVPYRKISLNRKYHFKTRKEWALMKHVFIIITFIVIIIIIIIIIIIVINIIIIIVIRFYLVFIQQGYDKTGMLE